MSQVAPANGNGRRPAYHDGPTPEKKPISNEYDERALLGCIIFDPRILGIFDDDPEWALDRLFSEPKHQSLFNILRGMKHAKIPITIQTIQSIITDSSKEGEIGGLDYLAVLEDNIFSLSGAPAHRQNLISCLSRRYPIEIGREYAHTDEFAERMGEAIERVKQLDSGGSMADRCHTAAQLVDMDPLSGDHDLIGNGYFRRGHVLTIAAPSGVGKTSFAAGLATGFAAGKTISCITPTRPMIVGYLDAENDMHDMGQVFAGAMLSPGIRGVVGPDVLGQIRVYSVPDVTGDPVKDLLRNICKDRMLDLLIVDCAHAYAGGEFSQERVTKFMRECLIATAIEYGIGIVLIHHTAKPPRTGSRAHWTADEHSYSAYGPSELTNASRAVMGIESTPVEGIFVLRASKRRQRLGWADQDGKPTSIQYIAHQQEGDLYYWRPATQMEILDVEEAQEEASKTGAGRKPKGKIDDVKHALAALSRPATHTELWRAIVATRDCSERTAKSLIKNALNENMIKKTMCGGYDF